MDPYQVLGLDPAASVDEAESTYHQLLRIHHPDLHHAAGPARVAEAEARTRVLNSAIHSIRVMGAAGRDARGTTATATDPGPRPSGPAWTEPVDDDSPCLLCGRRFSTAATLRDHVGLVHVVSHDRRLRRRHRRRPVRPLFGVSCHSPWRLLPMNVAAALGLAFLSVPLWHDSSFAPWVFALAMTPTAVRALGRGAE